MVETTAEATIYLNRARDVGCPEDQAENFLAGGYVALPKALLFHAAARSCDQADGPTMIGFGGARGPGKSHTAFAQVGLDDCQRRSGLKVLFLRQIQRAAAESFEDLVQRVFMGLSYKAIENRLDFANGSKILLGGFHDERDINRYLGIEYDVIVVEEANTLTARKLDMLAGSCRTTRDDWRARMYLTFNPGGIGHANVKQMFVMPNRKHEEKRTRFIFSTYQDNPFIHQEYIDYLEHLQGPLGKAWRDGDWDVFEGMALPAWNYERHVITQMPDNWAKWPKVRSVDWGDASPFCCLWGCRNPDNGRMYVYREVYETRLTDRQQAETILTLTPPAEHITITYADPSMWPAQEKDDTTSTVYVYKSVGVPLDKADNARLSGKRKVDRLLGDLPDGKPGLQIHASCVNLIRTLPELVFSTLNVEDVDTHQEDHAYDALRYLLTAARDYKQPTADKTRQPANPWIGLQGV